VHVWISRTSALKTRVAAQPTMGPKKSQVGVSVSCTIDKWPKESGKPGAMAGNPGTSEARMGNREDLAFSVN
jgi:hypothetical protein